MAPGRRRSPSRTSTYLASRKRASRSGSSGRVLRSSSSSMKLRRGIEFPQRGKKPSGDLGLLTLGCGNEARWKAGKTQTASFPLFPTALGNPADRAGFPHSHRADGRIYQSLWEGEKKNRDRISLDPSQSLPAP